MFSTPIDLYNFPTTFVATAEPFESGIRVVVEDNSRPFSEIFADTWSVSKFIDWSSYNIDGKRVIEMMSYALAEQLRNNQFGVQK